MNDYASGCIRQIQGLGFRSGTQLNIFCSSCSGNLKIFSGGLDKVEIEKYLNRHREHEGCFFGFSDGRRWKIQNDGMEFNQPLLQPSPEPGAPVPELLPLPVKEKESQAQDHIEGKELDEELKEVDIENEGWIKLHRKILKNPIFKDAVTLQLWIYLLLKANHEPQRFIFNGKEITVGRGQFITGLRRIVKDTGITIRRVITRFSLLETLHMMSRKTSNQFSMITIGKYNYYQDSSYSKGYTKGHAKGYTKGKTDVKRMLTNNNDKNEKKEEIARSVKPKRAVAMADQEYIETLRANPAFKGIDIDREVGKLDAWLLTPRGRGKKKTQQRLFNWLCRVDKPMVSESGKSKSW